MKPNADIRAERPQVVHKPCTRALRSKSKSESQLELRTSETKCRDETGEITSRA